MCGRLSVALHPVGSSPIPPNRKGEEAMSFVKLAPGEAAMLNAAKYERVEERFFYRDRPEECVLRDEKFLQAWLLARSAEREPTIGLELVSQWVDGPVWVLDDEEKPRKVQLPKGVYTREGLEAAAKTKKSPLPASILPDSGLPFISLTQHSNDALVGLLPGTKGQLLYLRLMGKRAKSKAGISPRSGGFLWKLFPSGKLRLQRPLTTAELTDK